MFPSSILWLLSQTPSKPDIELKAGFTREINETNLLDMVIKFSATSIGSETDSKTLVMQIRFPSSVQIKGSTNRFGYNCLVSADHFLICFLRSSDSVHSKQNVLDSGISIVGEIEIANQRRHDEVVSREDSIGTST